MGGINLNKYTLDTNIIMKNPHILEEIRDSHIFIPSVVLQELDNHKNDVGLGKAVRLFSRYLDNLHEKDYITESGNILYFMDTTATEEDLQYLGGKNNDNIIIHIAKECNSILLSDDVLVRVKARNMAKIEAHGLTEKSSENNLDEFYKGYIEMKVEDEIIDTLYRERIIDIDYINLNNKYPHMFIVFKGMYNESSSAIGKINKDSTKIELIQMNNRVYDISPKNVQQIMALTLLMDPDIPLVTMIGKAGSGKTLMATAAGLEQTETDVYKNVCLTKPIIAVGEEMGFLPGDEQEKLGPHMRSYYDSLAFLLGDNNCDIEQLGINIEALAYMRGRSIPSQYIVIDEAQNLTQHEVKTFITRAGEGSKIILMGDPQQVDKKSLTEYNNGLVYVMEKFMDQRVHGHVTLEKTVRSELADIASDIL